MKNLMLYIFVVMFGIYTANSYATDFVGAKTTAVLYIPAQGNSFYSYGLFGHNIGYMRQEGDVEIAKTKYTFDFTSIPSNANLTSVSLSFNFTNYINVTYKFTITTIGDLSSPQQIWEGIPLGGILFQDLFYGSGNRSTPDLTTWVNNHKNSYAYLGDYSQNETYTDSYANVDITVSVTWSTPGTNINFSADNNFTVPSGSHGSIVIDGVQHNNIPPTGYPLTRTLGQNITLGAVSDQDDDQNHQMIWHTGPINQSYWGRDGEIMWNDQSRQFQVSQADDGKKYMANLRKNYALYRDDHSEFDGTVPHAYTWHCVELNSKTISAPLTKTINNRLYNFSQWSDGNVNYQQTVTPTDNTTYTAQYKYKQHSNVSNTFTNNNQRKIAKTNDGQLHLVYDTKLDGTENYIFYENSTNNGASWELKNNCNPIDKGKSPSLDFAQRDAVIPQLLIVNQYKSGNDSWIEITYFEKIGTTGSWTNTDHLGFRAVIGHYDDIDCMPLVALLPGINGQDQTFAVVFKGIDGLYYQKGLVGENFPSDTWGLSLEGSVTKITTTNSNSINPNLYKYANGAGNSKFKLVWEEDRQIKYADNLQPASVTIVNDGDGFSYNDHPSFLVNSSGAVRVAWLARHYQIMPPQTVFRTLSSERFSVFGSGAASVNINKSDDDSYFAFAWSESGTLKFVDNTLTGYRTISGLTAQNVQVTNGSSSSYMYAEGYNNSTLPYYFGTSNNLNSFYNLGKVTSLEDLLTGREGVIHKNGAEFYFMLGDLKLNGEPVNFINVDDTVSINTKEKINQCLISEPIELNDNSQFEYSVTYGITDSLQAVNLLGNSGYANFKVLLIDDVTDEILGTFDDVTFNREDLVEYENISYQVNTSGIGNRTVRLKLEVNDNLDPSYSLLDAFNEQNVMGKKKLQKIDYNSGTEKITSYNLYQNFPNPFNPATTINYQVPKNSFVTLKVYDILGREVAALVNEQKTQGRYSVNFDASPLASGVYIYQIRANDYISSKKMILLK